jgi:F-type H+-transporting ATPase subunit b
MVGAATTEQSPGLAEVLWGVGALAVLVFFVWRVGLPAMRRAAESRRVRLATRLEGADAAAREAEETHAVYTQRLADAAGEADRIIAEGRAQAAGVRREMELDTERELARLREQAVAEIDTSRAQAIADVREETADLAASIADQLTRRHRDGGTEDRFIRPADPRPPHAS